MEASAVTGDAVTSGVFLIGRRRTWQSAAEMEIGLVIVDDNMDRRIRLGDGSSSIEMNEKGG